MRKIKNNTIKCAVLTGVLSVTTITATADIVSSTPAGQKTMSKFMESLARYITWPESSFSQPNSPFKYCLLGKNSIYPALNKRLSAKTIKKRGFKIIQLDQNAIEESKTCHVVFIADNQIDKVRSTIDALSGLPVLTTGDIDKFAASGGMVGFFGNGSKVALQINKKRLETGNLKASSKLYRVSTF